MLIQQQALSLFDYIGNSAKADEALNQAAKQQKANNVSDDLAKVSSGINQGKFDEIVKQMEKGELNIDLPTMKNYLEFNKRKIGQELNQQASAYGVKTPVKVSYSKDGIKVEDDTPQGKALQNYLDKDKKLNDLMQQTSKLSQFYEWGKVKEQAAEYKKAKVDEDKIVDYLKAARAEIMQDNQYQLSSGTLKLDSEGKAENLIKQYNKTFDFKQK